MARKSQRSQGGNLGMGSAGTGNPKTQKRKKQRASARGSFGNSTVPQAAGQTVRTVAPDQIRIAVSSRLQIRSEVNAGAAMALAINLTPTWWAQENIDDTDVHTNVQPSHIAECDAWLHSFGGLFAQFRWVNLALEWIPKASTVTEGELVVGQLLDQTDVLPSRIQGTGGAPPYTTSWAGETAAVESLSHSCSFPVRQRTKIPLRTTSTWSKLDDFRYVVESRESSAGGTWQSSAVESAIHYNRDGCVIAVPSGLTNLAGSAKVADLGHFRLVGTAEFMGRNTTSAVAASAIPSLVSKVQKNPTSNRQMFEPVKLSSKDLHILEIGVAGQVSRRGPDWLTSPFLGVHTVEESNPDGSRPFRRITVQFDPDRSGWTSALVWAAGGEIANWTDIRGLRLRSGLWFTSVTKTGRFSLCAPLDAVVTIASRPCEENLMEAGGFWEPPRRDLAVPDDFVEAVVAKDEVDTPAAAGTRPSVSGEGEPAEYRWFGKSIRERIDELVCSGPDTPV